MIIDFHTHVFPPDLIASREALAARDPWFAEIYGNPRARMATADDLLTSMAAAGVDRSVAMPFGWRDPGLAVECNSYLIEAMRRSAGRIIGLASIQPLSGKWGIAEIERCAAAGMPGIGELMPHGQGYRLSDTTLLADLADAAQALGMFVLTHTSEPVGHTYLGKGNVSPADFAAFITAFPDLRVVAAHWGGGFPFYELMPEVRDAAANVWYDSAASLYLYRPEVFVAVQRAAGAHKLLWATDFPLIKQERMLAYARAAGMDDATLALALGGNAATLLGMSAGGSPAPNA